MTGDLLIGNRLAYNDSDPERGDIAIFYAPDEEDTEFIKRVIGLPGDHIEIKDAKIYINGSQTPLDEPYLNEEWVDLNGPLVYDVPDGCYFMLGDNRNNSKDSRAWNNTFVKRDKILAKAGFRYFLFNKIGIVE